MGSSSADDCYFYYYSSCTKGSDCPFRHCEAALGTETVCTLWRAGVCYRANCKFRHMESRINRSSIPCYWENQPGGCRKPHCVFFHHGNRSNLNVLTKAEGLILPISSQPTSPSKTVDSPADNMMESSESHSLSSSHSIQPVVVSLGEGEESDTESTTSTPIKIISSLGKKTSSPLKNTSVPAVNVTSFELDLGIKTLEQIKMEKIHRESEHFYNPGQTHVTDPSAECAILETMYNDNESNGYYPQEYETTAEELTSQDLGMESYQNASLYPVDNEMNNVVEGCSKSPESAPEDLRHVLKKKRHAPEKEKFTNEPSIKRIISLKKSADASEELAEVLCVRTQSRNEGDISFRVKTLEEIRKEKEKRQSDRTAPSSFVEEIQDEGNDVDKPITNLSLQVKGPSVEDKVKLDTGKPILNLSYCVKEQSVENKVKPGGSKRKLCRKPLELYKSLRKEQSDTEDERMLERYATQVVDSVSDGEDVAKNITQEIIPYKEEGKLFGNSLKRACDSDMPIASKIRKTITLQRISPQKMSESGVYEEKPSRQVVANQKNGNSVTLKRPNIIRCKNFSNLSSSQSSATDEDFSNQCQNSDSQKELSSQTSELSASSNLNGSCMDSSDFNEKTEDIEMSDDKKPSVPLDIDKKESLTPSTVDEFDTLFLGTESDICIDETGESTVPKAEDLFLEFEKIIQS